MTCPSRVLLLPRHLSAHGHGAVAACELDEHLAPEVHAGRLLEVDGATVVQTYSSLVEWLGTDQRVYLQADGAPIEPPTCPREIGWLPGARCCLPDRHGGKCRP